LKKIETWLNENEFARLKKRLFSLRKEVKEWRECPSCHAKYSEPKFIEPTVHEYLKGLVLRDLNGV